MRQVHWVMLLVIAVSLVMWWGFIQQIIFGRPWGSKPAPDWAMWIIWPVSGILFPLTFAYLSLIVEVDEFEVRINYRPLSRRTIPLADIQDAEAISYRPIRDFGGWGIRGGASRRIYNVSGNQAVELTLVDGKRIVIGSQAPQDLLRAIDRGR